MADDSYVPSVAVFDEWYTDLAGSSARDDMVGRLLGLPAGLRSTSLLPGYGIDDVVAVLDLDAGRVLLDLACGRGGYGLEIARRTGADLIGIDFSTVAIGLAREQASSLALAGRAEFRPGELIRTGLGTGTVDAVLCIDSIQFAPSLPDALTECRRVLRPGRPLVITNWEPRDRDHNLMPQRFRDLDLATQLPAAGFANVRVREMSTWHQTERTLWEAAIAVNPDANEGLRGLQEEAHRVLAVFDVMQRVLATATAPA
jgi:SAM-dependent methyltransferase